MRSTDGLVSCGVGLFIRFTARAFRKLLSIYVFSYFPFGFECRIWDLVVSVPDHCLSFYLWCRSSLWPVGSPYETTQMLRSHEAVCLCGFGCRTSLWPVGSPYEITQLPRSHEAPEQFTGPIRAKNYRTCG